MFHAIKTVRTYQQTPFPPSLSHYLGRQTSSVRFREINKISSQPDCAHHMEKSQENPSEKTGDVMSHSFGEGYATRSDEEGFGGIYSGNQSLPKTETDKLIHENHPAYDKTQGSEVKDKEKARHQTNASS
ncbi:hypothetical protein L6164_020029 [Bauhinia variegata]|uniref:Uncharacterized protein n=1 Tax=Bauhinia variegata TaxID=167791 RepID=A0ACB9MVR0_BAUVA|nr:hypothetical protein L6164_020029 [Bauhinia variegata]